MKIPMSKRLILLTADINFGKTSSLMRWVSSRENVGGFLTPDIDGSRKIFSIRDKEYMDFQVMNESLSNEEVIEVGRFKFLRSGFDKMHDMLINDMSSECDVVIIDELGKLELREEGLCDSIHQALEIFRKPDSTSSLVIVIRDFLLAEAREKFDLKGAEIYELRQDRIFDPGL